jgi:hypothetical protein
LEVEGRPLREDGICGVPAIYRGKTVLMLHGTPEPNRLECKNLPHHRPGILADGSCSE